LESNATRLEALQPCWIDLEATAGRVQVPIHAGYLESVAALRARLRTRLSRVQLSAIRKGQAHLTRCQRLANMENLWAYLQRGWTSPLRLRNLVVHLALGRATVDVEDSDSTEESATPSRPLCLPRATWIARSRRYAAWGGAARR
jgi:hypothetical protein